MTAEFKCYEEATPHLLFICLCKKNGFLVTHNLMCLDT